MTQWLKIESVINYDVTNLPSSPSDEVLELGGRDLVGLALIGLRDQPRVLQALVRRHARSGSIRKGRQNKTSTIDFG